MKSIGAMSPGSVSPVGQAIGSLSCPHCHSTGLDRDQAGGLNEGESGMVMLWRCANCGDRWDQVILDRRRTGYRPDLSRGSNKRWDFARAL